MNTEVRFFSDRSEFKTKRLFDIVIAATMLVLFAPFMLTIMLYLRFHCRGSVFFGHTRIGLENTPFQCLKFRTMVADAEDRLEALLASDPALRRQWNEHHKLDNDPRIVPGIGAFLRNSSLDELPQLWNVLIGEMSLVGPRPVTEDELIQYGKYRGHYAAVRPGLTGPWQIGGRSNSSYADRVKLDVRYVETASVPMDVLIFVKTVIYFISGRLTGGR